MGRAARFVAITSAALVLASCGGGGSGGAGDTPGPGSTPAPTTASNVVITQATDQTGTYLLQAGLFKLSWTTSSCPNVDIVITQQDGAFTYEKKSATSFNSSIVTGVKAGTYKVEQKAPDCTTFKIDLDWIGGGG